jgi:sugar O-acyltransferase (sialic acid O-acetyltransferase NeuD family)
MNKSLILIGSGGHASVLLDVLKMCDRKVLGVVDPKLLKEGKSMFNGLKVLGDDSQITKFDTLEVELVNGIGPSTSSFKKQEIENRYSSLGYTFATVIHPSAIINCDAIIGIGVQIMAGAIIQSGVSIAKGCVINSGSIIEHDCMLSSFVHVAPGAVLCGNVKLLDNVYVGANAVITQNIKVSENSIVGAGTTLTKNLGASIKYIGKKI